MNSDKNLKKQTVFKEESEDENNFSDAENTITNIGIEQNIAGLLCYLIGFISGIAFLIIEKENRFVRFHANQSILISATIFIASFILNIIPFIGRIITIFIALFSLILWIFLMYKAYKGEWYKFPIAGDIAKQQIDK